MEAKRAGRPATLSGVELVTRNVFVPVVSKIVLPRRRRSPAARPGRNGPPAARSRSRSGSGSGSGSAGEPAGPLLRSPRHPPGKRQNEKPPSRERASAPRKKIRPLLFPSSLSEPPRLARGREARRASGGSSPAERSLPPPRAVASSRVDPGEEILFPVRRIASPCLPAPEATPGALGALSILAGLARARLRETPSDHSPARRPCRVRYSWQALGTGSQTSRTLVRSLLEEASFPDDETTCSVKYSWQIIGLATQTSRRDFAVAEGRSGVVLAARPDAGRRSAARPETRGRNGRRVLLRSSEATQTSAAKACQTVLAELYAA